jgi:hypothetical protein
MWGYRNAGNPFLWQLYCHMGNTPSLLKTKTLVESIPNESTWALADERASSSYDGLISANKGTKRWRVFVLLDTVRNKFTDISRGFAPSDSVKIFKSNIFECVVNLRNCNGRVGARIKWFEPSRRGRSMFWNMEGKLVELSEHSLCITESVPCN